MTNILQFQQQEQAMVASLVQHARPATTADAPPGALVKITGTAQPGQGGPLRARLSGVPCVWYRAGRIPTDGPPSEFSFGPSRLPSSLSSTTVLGRGGMSAPSEERSSTPFVLADAAGQLLVDTAGAHVDSTLQSQSGIDDPHPWNLLSSGQAITIEWVVPPGQQVFVVGQVVQRPDGTRMLVAPPGGRVVVSTSGEAALLQKAAAFATVGGGVGRAMIIVVSAVVALLLAVVLVLVIVLR